jgi:hypothetical protein
MDWACKISIGNGAEKRVKPPVWGWDFSDSIA